MLTHAAWADVAGLRHGFLDAADCGRSAAWEPVVASLGVPLPVVTPRQVHGSDVAVAEAPPAAGDAGPEADGVVSVAAGLVVGVVTADCVPVLVLDRGQRAVAALHAGWRGAAHGVLGRGVERLRQHAGSEPTSLEAVIGPAIGGCCYEVGPEVREAFEAASPGITEAAWTPRGDRVLLDLPLAVELVLGALGVGAVTRMERCTRCDSRYYSYRRDGAGTGRQLSFIGWT